VDLVAPGRLYGERAAVERDGVQEPDLHAGECETVAVVQAVGTGDAFAFGRISDMAVIFVGLGWVGVLHP
jgi:hypothetical protein